MTRVQRRQRLAGAAVVGAAAAFIWSGAPEAIAAAGAHLSLADVLVLLLVAALLFAVAVVVTLVLLGDALRWHEQGRARLAAHDERQAHRIPAPRRVSPARLRLTTDHEAAS